MLASGQNHDSLSRPIDNPILLNVAPAELGERFGRIVHLDHFGNATTNFARDAVHLAAKIIVRVGRRRIGRIRRTYGDVAPGAPLALFGSSGLLEIAVRDGSAAHQLNLRVGDRVRIE
jgi:S-adenosylmethionine hydrolase